MKWGRAKPTLEHTLEKPRKTNWNLCESPITSNLSKTDDLQKPFSLEPQAWLARDSEELKKEIRQDL